jgi:hypothetical protein
MLPGAFSVFVPKDTRPASKKLRPAIAFFAIVAQPTKLATFRAFLPWFLSASPRAVFRLFGSLSILERRVVSGILSGSVLDIFG